MSNAIIEKSKTTDMAVIEKVILNGDLAELAPADRVRYYNEICKSLGLNPLTQPFQYIKLNGKLTLYARKDATEQLRKINKISITKIEEKIGNDIYRVFAYAVDANGNTDVATGAVNIKGLSGENLANAMMKAETKAKRRVTLSMAGLGWLDESEISSIADAKVYSVDKVHAESSVKALENSPQLIDIEAFKNILGSQNNMVDLQKEFAKAWSSIKTNFTEEEVMRDDALNQIKSCYEGCKEKLLAKEKEQLKEHDDFISEIHRHFAMEVDDEKA